MKIAALVNRLLQDDLWVGHIHLISADVLDCTKLPGIRHHVVRLKP